MNLCVEISCRSQSGGSTPRAGLNPKEKEERRRELDRMREEDRARRAADAVSSYVWGILLPHSQPVVLTGAHI
jgi:hypothetical protein